MLITTDNIHKTLRVAVIATTLSFIPSLWSQNVASVSVPSTVTAGIPFNAIVTASNLHGGGPIDFAVTCTGCTVGVNGSNVMTMSTQTFSLTITSNNAMAVETTISARGEQGNPQDSNLFTLNPGPPPPATKLQVVTSPTSQIEGQSFSITVTAQDATGNTATTFHGDAALTATMNGQSVTLPEATLTNGVASVATNLLTTTGTWTITAASPGLASGTTTITITPGPLATIQIEAPTPVNAGDSFPVTVTVRDANNNLETSGTVTLTSSDPRVPSLGTVTIGTNGMGTLSASLQTAGPQTITGKEGVISGATGVQVRAGQATHLTVLAPSSEAAGSSFDVTITAFDQFGNVVTNYNQPVNLSSTDSTATGMGMITLTNGTTIVPTIHHIAGLQVITATSGPTDMAISAAANVTITATAATHFAVGAPASATAGVAFTFNVIAQDQFNNTATGYHGTVHYTSSDSNASLPADSTLTNGVGSFSATLKTPGNQTIIATDTSASSITGASNAIFVSASTLDHFVVTAPATTTAGTSFSVTAVAMDAYGNTITSYTGPATITSSDGHAVIPSTLMMFVSGTASFQAILDTEGTQSITVTDQANTTKKGTAQITVNSAAATKIVITATPTTVVAGAQFMFTVTAEDSFGNVVQNYTGTLRFTSSDPNAVNPPDSTLTNGTGTFPATLVTAGSQTLTATDTVNAMVTGTSNGIAVTPASLNHFQIVVPGTVTAGQQFSFIIAAKDQYNNTVMSYTGPVTITSADPQLQIIQPPSFVNGLSVTGQAVLKTAGDQTLTVTDPTTTVFTISPVIQVLPGAPDSIQIVSGNSSGPTPNNAPVPINTAFPNQLVISVSDTYGNRVPGQAVTFSAPGAGASSALSGSTIQTGINGQASVSATANQVAGGYAVTATIASSTQPPPSTSQVQFSLTNLPGAPASIHPTSGTPQTAAIGTLFAMPLVATVTDSAGNGVPGVAVTFSVPVQSGPSATLSSNAPVTNSQGNASVIATASSLAGSYQVIATAAGLSGTAVFNLQNTPLTPDQPTISVIVNAASFFSGAAPRSLQTIFGSNLATTIASATTVPLPTTLGGVTVTIGSTQVPLLYVSPTQINFQVPTELSTGQVVITVNPSPTGSVSAPMEVDPASPGIFLQIHGDITRAAAANTDGSTNGPSHPAPAGGYIQMFLTGVSPVTPPVSTGEVAPLTPLSHLQASMSATIGSRLATVQFAGAAPQMVIDQVNLQIPIDLPPGDYPVVISIDGVQSNSALISVGPAGSLQQ